VVKVLRELLEHKDQKVLKDQQGHKVHKEM
jgi:hypothetical protein